MATLSSLRCILHPVLIDCYGNLAPDSYKPNGSSDLISHHCMYLAKKCRLSFFVCFASLKQAVGNLFLDWALHTIISRPVIASLFKIVHNKITWAIVDD